LAELQKNGFAPPVELPPPPAASSPSMWDLPVLNWFRATPTTIVLGSGSTMDDKKMKKRDEIEKRYKDRLAKSAQAWQAIGDDHSEITLTPRKTDVRIGVFGLAWAPFWRLAYADDHAEIVPAFPRSAK
jgi:hypothetical protein